MEARKRLGALSTLVGLILLLVPTVAFAGQVDPYEVDIPLNSAHVGAIADEFQNGSCPDLGDNVDVWHFVSPANANFVSLTVTFKNSGTIVYSTGDFGPPDDSHAYVATSIGDELLSGEATIVTDKQNAPDKFNLSHTCPGTTTTTSSTTTTVPETTTTTQPETTTTVPETTTTTEVKVTTTVPEETTTVPEGTTTVPEVTTTDPGTTTSTISEETPEELPYTGPMDMWLVLPAIALMAMGGLLVFSTPKELDEDLLDL